MLTILLSVLGGLPRWIQLTAIAAIVSTIGYLVHDYSSRGEQIVALQHQLRTMRSDAAVADASLKVAQGNIKDLNDLLKVRQGDLQQTCAILQEIVTSTDPDDQQPVGGIIARTLKRLKEIRGE
jgi:hypothetical protein